MKRWTAALAAGFAIVLATAAPAAAKGADQVTITGPGLAKPIVLTGTDGSASANTLNMLSEGSGLFAAMFGGDSANAGLVADRPTAALGPKYQLAYRVPGQNPAAILKQDLYPFADGGPVTYTAAGQSVFGGKSQGGWYRGTRELARTLAKVGIAQPSPSPATQSAVPAPVAQSQPSGGGNGWLIAVLGVIVAAAAVAATTLAVLRRRPATY